MREASDPATLAFYDREARAYAASGGDAGSSPWLTEFLARLATGAQILELGCGAGREAQAMMDLDFEVDATDGSHELVREARLRLGSRVRPMLFDELDAVDRYDGVWANASLLHVPMHALPSVLKRVHRSLRASGVFAATYKAGTSGGRDRMGRYFNYPDRDALRAGYLSAGIWSSLELDGGAGGGYDNVATQWLRMVAIKH